MSYRRISPERDRFVIVYRRRRGGSLLSAIAELDTTGRLDRPRMAFYGKGRPSEKAMSSLAALESRQAEELELERRARLGDLSQRLETDDEEKMTSYVLDTLEVEEVDEVRAELLLDLEALGFKGKADELRAIDGPVKTLVQPPTSDKAHAALAKLDRAMLNAGLERTHSYRDKGALVVEYGDPNNGRAFTIDAVTGAVEETDR